MKVDIRINLRFNDLEKTIFWCPYFDKITKIKGIVSSNDLILRLASNMTRFIDDRITMILLCHLECTGTENAIAKEIAGYYCPAIAALPIRPAMGS